MFTYSAIVTGGRVYQLVMGGLLGACTGIVVGMAIYYGLMKVPTKSTAVPHLKHLKKLFFAC